MRERPKKSGNGGSVQHGFDELLQVPRLVDDSVKESELIASVPAVPLLGNVGGSDDKVGNNRTSSSNVPKPPIPSEIYKDPAEIEKLFADDDPEHPIQYWQK